MLATAVLVGSVGSTPIFGHAHEKPDADDHDHLHWAVHEHSHLHLNAARHGERHAAVEANDTVFHRHGMLFGIPFSLPAPTEPHDDRLVQNPLAMAVLTPGAAVVTSHLGSVGERIVCPDAFVLAPDPRAGIEPSATLLSGTQSLDPPGGHCALEARSGVLRC